MSLLKKSKKLIYWDETIKILHEYIFSYRLMRAHSQSLILKFANSIKEENNWKFWIILDNFNSIKNDSKYYENSRTKMTININFIAKDKT